jgi:hypothetical protein
MINILFYGNCQLYAIYQTLKLPKYKYNIFNITCHTTDINNYEFTEIVKKCDFIITQPMQDNYRGKDYLSTTYLINNKKENCKIIIFDSCHFIFYYFDLTYKFKNNEMLRKPIDYHYNHMIDCYKNNFTEEYYIENYVNNVDLKTSEELDTIANNSLNELNKRYNLNKEKYSGEQIYIISTYDYIKNNYKEKLLFYSMNHPTKYLIQYICIRIIDILEIEDTIDYNSDYLSNPSCILYKCIQKNVNFNITDCSVLTSGRSSIYDITQLYYNTYKEINY